MLASIEKIVPTLEDAAQILRVLARSATGQDMSVYTTLSTGPRRPGDPDGPEQYHVVLLDNGRSAMLGTEFQDMLRCIRCGACMNHCPVYHAVGGHAYGWVYPGPMGAVLTPALIGVDKAGHLPNASTFCGRCESVCPMRIPLPKMMRHWREREFERGLNPATQRYGLKLWAFFARRPALYRAATSIAMPILGMLGRGKGRFSYLPLAGGWTKYRDMPAPEGRTFMQQMRGRKPAPQRACHERPRRDPQQGAQPAERARAATGRRGPRQSPSDCGKRRRGSFRRAGNCPMRSASRCSQAWRKSSPRRSSGLKRMTKCRRRSPPICASATCRHRCAWATTNGLPPCRGRSSGRCRSRRGASDGNDEVGFSHATAAIAETGTLVMVSGSDNPTTINFLPEHHIVVVDAADIAGDLEAVLAKIRTRYGKGKMPRTVNLISGPSRSGDVEQKIILGAHGPRALHIIVVGG